MGDTLGSAILDSDAPRTIHGKKWYEHFLETIPEKQRTDKRVRTYKFDNGNKLKSIYVIYCDGACIKDKSDIPCTFKFTELYKRHVYLLKPRKERERTLVSIFGVTSLKSSTQGE